jgi:hypothetical protein
MSPVPPAPEEIAFYYHGLYRALHRYRTATIVGWIIVFAGLAGIPLGWRSSSMHGLLDMMLCGGTIVAGLVVVSEAVSFLAAYTGVRFPSTPSDPAADAEVGLVQDVRRLMNDVEEGGWQEAYAAIGALKTLGTRYGLPPPGSGQQTG